MREWDSGATYTPGIIPLHGEHVDPVAHGAKLANNASVVYDAILNRQYFDHQIINLDGQTDAATYCYRTNSAVYVSVFSTIIEIKEHRHIFNAHYLLNGDANPHEQGIKFSFIGSSTIDLEYSNAQGIGTTRESKYYNLQALKGETVTFSIWLKVIAGAGYAQLLFPTMILSRRNDFL